MVNLINLWGLNKMPVKIYSYDKKGEKRGIFGLFKKKEWARLLGMYLMGEDGILRIVIDLVNYTVDLGSDEEQIQSSALWALFQYLGTRYVYLRGAKGFRFPESIVFRSIFPKYNLAVFYFIEATSEEKAFKLLNKVTKALSKILMKALGDKKIDDPFVDINELAKKIQEEIFVYY